MKLTYKILRTIAVTVLLLAILLPAALYVALSTSSVQNYIRSRAQSELTNLLGAEVKIDHIAISPFNRVTLHGISVANPDTTDAERPNALTVRRLGAGINIWNYLAHDRIVLNYAEIIGLDAKLYRDSAGAPLNIQPIIDALAPKDKTKPPTRFDLAINTVVLRASSVSYDVGRDPAATDRFDPKHIAISALNADIQIPRLSNDTTEIDLRTLTLTERSGFKVSSLSALCNIRGGVVDLCDFALFTPTSYIGLNDQHIDTRDLNRESLASMPVDVSLTRNSHVTTADLAYFVPALAALDLDFRTVLHVDGTPDQLTLREFEMLSSNGVSVATTGYAEGLLSSEHPAYQLPRMELKADGSNAAEIINLLTPLDLRLARLLANAGTIEASLSAAGTTAEGNASLGLITSQGLVTLDSDYRLSGRTPAFSGYVAVDEFNLAGLLANVAEGPASKISDLSLSANFDVAMSKPIPDGSVQLELSSITYLGHTYTDIAADLQMQRGASTLSLISDCAGLHIDAGATLEPVDGSRALDFNIEASQVNLAHLGIAGRNPDRDLSFACSGSLIGSSIRDVEGNIDLDHLEWVNDSGSGLVLKHVGLACTRGEEADTISIDSELLTGSAVGLFDFTSIAPAVKAIIGSTMPQLAGGASTAQLAADAGANDFTYSFTLNTLDPLEPTVKIPVKILDPVRIFGAMSSTEGTLSASVDVPYLLQGKKIIEGTALSATVAAGTEDMPQSRGWLNFATNIPTKDGLMHLTANNYARDDRLDCHVGWVIDRERRFSGDLNLTAGFERDTEGNLMSRININPGSAVFNDTVWTVEPALITYAGKEITVDGFKAWRTNQAIEISGHASDSETDTITVSLDHIDLDYVFETLAIPTAMFGGNVSGKVYATRVLTPSPQAFTPGLDVKGIKYNGSVLGDAELRSNWSNESKSVLLQADITQRDGRHSYVDGAIFVFADSLDFRFKADRLPIGFLRTYMAAFATDVSGYATGDAHLWGTFKLIDMTGEIYGEDVRLTLGFTNTSYTTTDTVRLTPGRIDIQPLTIRDDYGNTATLSGWLTHKCFKSPEFKFEVTDARDLLVYDVKENPDQRWYGRVFGNGRAEVAGAPGIVDITMDMTTAGNSSFTYILSNALVAQDYTFLTFRDRDQALKDSIASKAEPANVLDVRKALKQNNGAAGSSNYRLDLRVDITPQASINLVMDPAGGDCVRAHGSGNLRMTYDAANEDLKMNGTYVVERGTYNFTLQDIIIKNFTLREGSSIAFQGDPYAAKLDIVASYQVKANISDLDQSFLEDKELNRTNVPVDALLIVKGDMRQPDITFDLDFPTLTQETNRKVRSIINTEEMMNRQIIYLLALNRFYTPEYMNATRGNEFFSVASSTLTSQFSKILGQLAENWSISPIVRSDSGDFSDVEVDVELSSQLLNNRLLLNGNFGYRDKSLNNNSFIGDFDIEYLLNPSGSWRLKAYNRYNDQNYYLKSALTTQGVGIVFKRDFDDFFSFLRHKKKPTADSIQPTPAVAPTAPVEQPDTSLIQFR